MSDELALKIGNHILAQYNRWTENPMGKKVIMPVSFPHSSDQPQWTMNVECDMPWFIEYYYEDGERKHKHWSMKEWFLHSQHESKKD